MGLGLVLLALLPAQPTLGDMLWRMALCGAGFGLFQSPNNHTIVTVGAGPSLGGASGMLGTARLTGQTLGAVLVALLFSMGTAAGNAPRLAIALAAAASFVASVFSALRLRYGDAAAAP
jgi:DHA2 family multidrug resistance protein-like MFS transporter